MQADQATEEGDLKAAAQAHMSMKEYKQAARVYATMECLPELINVVRKLSTDREDHIQGTK